MNRILILIIALFLTSCSQSKKESISEATLQSELPSLQITVLPGDTINVSSLPGKIVLFFFSPDCDHCQREATDIREHLNAFKNYDLYFIAARGSGEIEAFAKTYGLNDISNVHFAQAEVPDVVRVMGAIGTPTLYIYSDKKRLVKKFENETDVDEIVKFL